MDRRILIADDDAQIRNVLPMSLEQVGFDVREVSNGRDALKVALRDLPYRVVLDIGMPEIEGLEVCRELRKSTGTPILSLTAQGDEIDRVVGLELGADNYVSKPFSPAKSLRGLGGS